ncbi:threonine efflux protein [Thioclava sp. F1Mire-8]|uniref:ABC-three component system middle component 2 n=1 Tax=Thioclava sp. F1Mire-8 TaxID=1973006 RepID=UPI000B538DCD|nr:ABC-three component system middle component 2 [Thioclava sp. F1Mire-8]OWY04621.1 threonine efflux protein [Thioclava sp. F1Mire-8]
MTSEPFDQNLFNSPLEAGIRAIVILEMFEPKSFDISTLSLLDYFVVHTGDAGGPPSIHPEIEARAGEFFVRRHLVERGVGLMVRASVLEQRVESTGITFRSHETASAMLDLMTSSYNRQLKTAAAWLANEASKEGIEAFLDNLRLQIDMWSQAVITTEGMTR